MAKYLPNNGFCVVFSASVAVYCMRDSIGEFDVVTLNIVYTLDIYILDVPLSEIPPDACIFCFLPLSLCWNFKFDGFMRIMVWYGIQTAS